MKQSQKALLSVLGALAILVVVSVVSTSTSVTEINLDDMAVNETPSRGLNGFNKIAIEGYWQVKVVQGDNWKVSWSSVSKGTPNTKAKPDVRVFVKGKTLKLISDTSGNWLSNNDDRLKKAEIVMPALKSLNVGGAGEIDISGFDGNKLNIDIAGAANVNATDGHYEKLDLDTAGASEINLRGISVTNADVDIAGASKVELTMDGGELSGALAGAGKVVYYGEISKEDVKIAGFGKVSRGK